jgi:hypothetical protein
LTQKLPSGARVRARFRGMSTARHDALSVSLAAGGRSSRVQRLQSLLPKEEVVAGTPGSSVPGHCGLSRLPTAHAIFVLASECQASTKCKRKWQADPHPSIPSPCSHLGHLLPAITPEPGLPDKVLSQIHQLPCNRSGRLRFPCSAQLQSASDNLTLD